MSRLIITVLIAIIFTSNITAQDIVIQGTIKDANQKEILPFANVFLQKNYIGTVSNNNGAFKIIIPTEKRNDSLVISFIGYRTQTFLVSEIKDPLNVFLEEDQTTLNEVFVTGFTAESIIKKALKAIPNNYYSNPYKSKGFYRVSSEKNQEYIHLSEAVFEVYQSKIDKPKQQFKLEKMRAIKDEKASKGIDLGLNPGGIYAFDMVNNLNKIEVLNKAGLKAHNFMVEGSILINGQESYKIVFDQKDIKKSGYKGYMLIDKASFAFQYFEFGLSPKGLQYHVFGDAALRAMMKILGIKISMMRNNYQISYQKFASKYYLNNLGNDATLSFKSNRDHYNFKADTRVDYLVTKIDIDSVYPFTNEETLGQRKLIEEQNSMYDPDFWNDYTIILPTNDFNLIAKKIEANNQANNLKLELEEKLAKLPKDQLIRIDSILAYYNKKDLFNGNALIAVNGQRILEKSYNNSITNNNPNSQFRIGSLSKTFIALIMAQLEDENKIKYTDPMSKYLPNYPNGQVTIDQLLSHQSGIPNFLANNEYLSKVLSQKYSIEEVVNLFCSDSLEFEPGSKFEYSNSNFTILSLIAEKITGMDYKSILTNSIFKPLDMKDTYFGEPKDNSNLVTAFMYGQPEPDYDAQNVGGAGGITSTTSDLLKWSNSFHTEQLLSQSSIEKLFKPRAAYKDWEADYGYGWMIDRYMFSSSKKHQIVYHPGTDFGFYSMFVKQPDSGITIILLNNTGEFPRFEMTELILNELN